LFVPGKHKLKLANENLRAVEFQIQQPPTSTFLPQAEVLMSSEWKIYRTRFLIRAMQLTSPMIFNDCLGREHCGKPGDYLVETSDGSRRIAPREIFEDIYVAMGPAIETQAAQSSFPVDTRTTASLAS
jgi:hypothetical protein